MYHQTCADVGGENLPGSAIKDLLIVSVDSESPQCQIGKAITHCRIGVSIFDTRHLHTRTTDTNDYSILETFNFCMGKPERHKKNIWRFCFGQSKFIDSIEEIRHEIQNLISGRDVVLVVHGGQEDLAFLEGAQIDLRPLYILDTQKAAQHPLDLDRRPNLGELLTLLKCPFNPEMLHSAGNDANFTLRALLLIAALDAKNHLEEEHECSSLLWTLEGVATEFIPLKEFQGRFEKEILAYVKRVNPKSHGRRARRKIQAKAIRKKQAQLKALAILNAPDPIEVARACKKNWIKLLLS